LNLKEYLMSDVHSDAKDPEERRSRRLGLLIAFVSLCVAVLVFLFGRGVYHQWREDRLQDQPPSFVISAINTLEDSNQYEITDHWIEATSPVPGVELTFGLEIHPTYSGEPLGEVQVRVKGNRGQILETGKWSNLTKESGMLRVALDPYLLASEADLLKAAYQWENNEYTFPRTDLAIEVVRTRNPSSPLYTDTLTLVNTPWYHLAKASEHFLSEEQASVDVYIQGRNLGGASEFTAVAETYEITDMSGRPYQPWPKIGWAVKPIDGVFGRGEEFSTRISLPGDSDSQSVFSFEAGKCYGINTYVCKKQNYADFGQAGWRGTGEVWRFGNWGDFLLVCFPTQ
jgi:hypothetical protein